MKGLTGQGTATIDEEKVLTEKTIDTDFHENCVILMVVESRSCDVVIPFLLDTRSNMRIEEFCTIFLRSDSVTDQHLFTQLNGERRANRQQ